MKKTITRCLAGASIALIAAVGTGCGSDEPLANSNATSTAENASVPSFSEIDAALALDSSDEAVVKTALAEWRRGAGANDATRDRAGARHREMTFVAAVAPSLDDDQLGKLVSLIVARREIRRDEMRERRADCTPEQRAKLDARREQRMEQRRERRMEHAQDRVENRAAWLDAALELTDEQAARVRTALTTMTETRAAVHAARESGVITREQARDRMGAARDAFEEALATILTAEQQARLAILEPLFPGRLHHA